MEVTNGPDGRSLQTGSPLIILFFQDQGPDTREMLSRWFGTDFHCGLFVPLRVKDRPIGTLSVLRSNPRAPYTHEDAAFFQDLSNRAALSIENARLYVEEAQRVRELDALQVATAALLSTIDLETLLSRILDISQSAIPAADLAMLHLAPRQNSESQVLAASSDKDLRIRKAPFPRSERRLLQVVRDYLPALIHDTHKGPDLAVLGLPIELENARSAVVAPLLLGDEVLGLLSLRASRTAAFVEADKRLLMSFANTTTAALQNAMLHAEVQRLAMTDSLTSVYNRRGFFEFGKREIERAARFGRPVSALMVDVDYFKEINDTYGHTEGDHVLRILAGRLRSIIREIDVLGRYGGDEFVILLPETDSETACIVAERIRQRIAEHIVINEVNEAGQVELSMTASLGVASQAATVQDINSLIKRADTAAYVAKQKGRNRVEVD
jgi:diguanylate cyclase (GGDEF)-like protein